jgi:protein translocase SecG subunit
MNTITQLLPWFGPGIAILLILSILLGRAADSLDGAFGGGSNVTTRFTRRGGEKLLFYTTFVLAILFS